MSRIEAYRQLDLTADATAEDVQSAFRRKAKVHHPDSEGGDPERFKEITRAYETLTD